jgi:hypothetical protein
MPAPAQSMARAVGGVEGAAGMSARDCIGPVVSFEEQVLARVSAHAVQNETAHQGGTRPECVMNQKISRSVLGLASVRQFGRCTL